MHVLWLLALPTTFNQIAKAKVLLKFRPLLHQKFVYDCLETGSHKEPRRQRKSSSDHFTRTETITSVDSHKFTQHVETTSIPAQPIMMGYLDPFNMDLDETLSFDGDLLGADFDLGGSFIGLKYPSKPVSVGETWDRYLTSNKAKNRIVTYKLAALSNSEARILAWIKKPSDLVTKQPFLFVVDRNSGKPKYVRGTIITKHPDLSVKIECKMTAPIHYNKGVR